MDYKIIAILLLVLPVFSQNDPKVYEDFMEYGNTNENIRTVRQPQPQFNVKIYSPPIFNYGAAVQQDRRKFRYAQQQQIDFANLSQNNRKHVAVIPDFSPIDQNLRNFAYQSSIGRRNMNQLRTVNKSDELLNSDNNTVKENVQIIKPNLRQTSRSNRKLKPSSFYEKDANDLETDNSQIITEKIRINRQDHMPPNSYNQIVYVQPNILKQNFGLDMKTAQEMLKPTTKRENQLAALNDLIGKNPNVQLEGLKKLLESSPNKYILPALQGPQPFSLKDHTPITERTIDVPNHQTRPNIKVEHEAQSQELPATSLKAQLQANDHALAAIQAQLDATSKAQTEEVLTRAAHQAQAHVEAQHKAIAFAQAQAQKAALAQIAAQNNKYALPQALPLTATIVAVPTHQTLPVAQAFAAREEPTPQSYAPIHQAGQDALTQSKENEAAIQAQTQEAEARQQAIVQAQYQSQNEAEARQAHAHHQTQKEADARQQAIGQEQYRTQKEQQAIAQAQYQTQKEQQAIAQEQYQTQKEADVRQQAIAHAQYQTEVEHRQQLAAAQDHGSADAYQQVVLETQHHAKDVKKVYTKTRHEPAVEEHEQEHGDLQYAAKYAFGYRIKDFKMGNDFGHEEQRDGKSAKGHYHVLLPDGRLQKVEYFADDNGYHAKVTYENLAHH